jgi:hypothetical protein
MNELEKLAKEFVKKTAQTAPDLTSEQAQAKLKEMDSQELLQKVEQTITQDLGLKNVQPSDIVFKQFQVQTTADNKQYMNYNIAFSQGILAQINAAVAANRQAHPNFLLSNYILNIIQRLNPGMPAKGVVQMG